MSVYLERGGHDGVVATLGYFRRFRAARAAGATVPEERFRWELHVAINRKSELWPQGVHWKSEHGFPFVTAGYAPFHHRALRGPGDPTCRKFDDDYQRGLLHDAHAANNPRLRCRFFNTPELRRRFRKRLEADREDW